MAVENLWHLHYTLVFPIFVGLRETISVIIEQLPGETRASARLDRRRRIGTALAAMLLAGGGLLLAWSVGVLANPGLTDVVMQPWAVAQAGLSNAAVFLGLSTAAASLYWLWREIASLRPLRDWSPEPPVGQRADRACGASFGPARGWRALRLPHGMRYARPAGQPQRPARAPQAPRDRRVDADRSRARHRRRHRCRHTRRMGGVPRSASVLSRHPIARPVRAGQPRRQHRRSHQHGTLRHPLECRPRAPPAQVRGGARCHPGRACPHRGPRVRRPRAHAQGLPAGRRAPGAAARARRTGHVARTMGDRQGVGRHLPAGRLPTRRSQADAA